MQQKIWPKILNKVHVFRIQLLLCFFLATLLWFWPGFTLHKNELQYLQAVSGAYADHHPPLMAFIWHYLDLIYPGSGLMFLMQLSLVYGAIMILMRVADALPLPNPAIASLLLLIVPIYPQILINLIVVFADVHFAGSFLLSAAILSYYTIYKKHPHLIMLHIVFTLMVYGAAIKYEGQYAVFILAFWLGSLHVKRKSFIIKLFVGILVYLLVLLSIVLINHALVPQQSNYATKHVHFNDIKAFVYKTDQELMPRLMKGMPIDIASDLQKSPTIYVALKNTCNVTLSIIMSHVPIIILGVAYLLLSLYMWKFTASKILFAFTSTALIFFVLVLTMFNAATAIYTFMPILLIHAAHIFAYSCVTKIKKVH